MNQAKIENRFPEFILLKASAGSGKTHALSLRFVEFLLSHKIPHNHLRNILAITFTNNASQEMKTRILEWLKGIYFKDAFKISQIKEKIALSEDELSNRALHILETILDNYSDFQVTTIDSFMTGIFKASCLDLGYPPDFKIVIDHSPLLEYAFYRYLRNVCPGSPEGKTFELISQTISENQKDANAYPWDPTSGILDKINELYTKLSASSGSLIINENSNRKFQLQNLIAAKVEEIEKHIQNNMLSPSKRSAFYSKIIPAINDRRYNELLSVSTKSNPVLKDSSPAYYEVLSLWEELNGLLNKYRYLYACDYFTPYLKAYQSIEQTVERTKHQEESLFLQDINKKLSAYINKGNVPDIYLRLGDRIYHYLIDEFQDTAPIQWQDMIPLLENALSQDGSLFVVGDTKQAIYGFRNADYRIMRDLEKGDSRPFRSVEVKPEELGHNYRSGEKILEFTKEIFIENLPREEKYGPHGSLSGLTNFTQKPIDKQKGKGYVQIELVEKNEAEPPEKKKVQTLVQELKARGYGYSDIAILAFKNEQVVALSTWLNEIGVPMIPFSELDIRNRKIIGELLALLKFLDSPIDNLAFTTFIRGEIFKAKLERDGKQAELARLEEFLFEAGQNKDNPLYITCKKEMAEIWTLYFETLFKIVGYYPLYDLVTLIYREFEIHSLFPKEEAALTRLLETIMEFEGLGLNDLREFLAKAKDEASADAGWNIEVPSSTEAVRVMSIHKAKGLGFPVVILVLYYSRSPNNSFYISEKEGRIKVYKITKEISEAEDTIRELYEETDSRNKVNELNTLYVAITRAKSELYLLGVYTPSQSEDPEKQKTPWKSQYPLSLLKPENHPPLKSKPEARSEQARGSEYQAAPCYRHTIIKEPAPNTIEVLNYENILRGDTVHLILSQMDYAEPDIPAKVSELIKKTQKVELRFKDWDRLQAQLIEFLSLPEAREYFTRKEGREVFSEKEFANAYGHSFKMDRLVVDRDRVTVIDYKTGFEPDPEKQAAREKEYHQQLMNYLAILKDIYPDKRPAAWLAYFDRKKWEPVK
jgi:ATP-dependent exoDNAse (exonuclease V) beta subunit